LINFFKQFFLGKKGKISLKRLGVSFFLQLRRAPKTCKHVLRRFLCLNQKAQKQTNVCLGESGLPLPTPFFLREEEKT